MITIRKTSTFVTYFEDYQHAKRILGSWSLETNTAEGKNGRIRDKWRWRLDMKVQFIEGFDLYIW